MKKLFEEFKKFISKGNVIDMAVGVIIGGAFTAIVNSVVSDLFMPIISLITGGAGYEEWMVTIGEGEGAANFRFGAFFAAVINFLVIAIVVFCFVKMVNKLRDKMPKKEETDESPAEKECSFCLSKIPYAATRCPHCTSHLNGEDSEKTADVVDGEKA